MPNFWNIAHFVGGMAAAFIVIAVMHKKFHYGSVALITLLSGLIVNLFWEFLADYWHILPYGAAKPEIRDILLGGFGSGLVTLLWLYFRKR